MDLAPLNLAHFHERRANRFLQRHRYDEAYKALETSLFYLQDAYKNVRLPQSQEVLNTQKWDYERKLRQIEMRKQQHERMKHKEFVPFADANTTALVLRQDSNVSTQSVSKSIDKTIREFDAKLSLLKERTTYRSAGSKENRDPRVEGTSRKAMVISEPLQQGRESKRGNSNTAQMDEHDEFPSLTPLELPKFDTDVNPSMANYSSLAESFQK